jgi:hypothetical protein
VNSHGTRLYKKVFLTATCALLCGLSSIAHAQQTVPKVNTPDVFPFNKGNVESDATARAADAESKPNPTPSPSASPEAIESEPPRRAQAAPFDGVFLGAEYLGPVIGVTDTDPVWPLTKAL